VRSKRRVTAEKPQGMVLKISCFSALRPASYSSKAKRLANGVRGLNAHDGGFNLEAADSQIPGGLAGIRERMAAMGHAVMSPEPQEEPRDSPAGPASASSDFCLSADMCTGDGRSIERKPPPGAKAGKSAKEKNDKENVAPSGLMSANEQKQRVHRIGSAPSNAPPQGGAAQRALQAERDSESVDEETAQTFFPGRSEVQKLHANYLRESLQQAKNAHDEYVFEADGEGQTEAERLLNAFAVPGRAPAMQKRDAEADAGSLSSTPEAGRESAPRGTGLEPSGVLKQQDNLSTQAGGAASPPTGEHESQRKSAISQLIKTQGIRPSELRRTSSGQARLGREPPVMPGASALRGPDRTYDAGAAAGQPAHAKAPVQAAVASREQSAGAGNARGAPHAAPVRKAEAVPSCAGGEAGGSLHAIAGAEAALAETAGRVSPAMAASPQVPGLQVMPHEEEYLPLATRQCPQSLALGIASNSALALGLAHHDGYHDGYHGLVQCASGSLPDQHTASSNARGAWASSALHRAANAQTRSSPQTHSLQAAASLSLLHAPSHSAAAPALGGRGAGEDSDGTRTGLATTGPAQDFTGDGTRTRLYDLTAVVSRPHALLLPEPLPAAPQPPHDGRRAPSHLDVAPTRPPTQPPGSREVGWAEAGEGKMGQGGRHLAGAREQQQRVGARMLAQAERKEAERKDASRAEGTKRHARAEQVQGAQPPRAILAPPSVPASVLELALFHSTGSGFGSGDVAPRRPPSMSPQSDKLLPAKPYVQV
jgi:hypothetical protein